MQFLSSGPGDPDQDLVPSELVPNENAVLPASTYQPYAMAHPGAEETGSKINPGQLLRRYWLLLAGLMVLGAIAGFVSVVLSAPRYRSRMLLEVENSSGNLMKGVADSGNDANSEVNIQTQISILTSGSFR